MEQRDYRANPLLSLHLLNFFIYGIAAIFTSYLQLYYLSTGMDKLQIGLLLAAGPVISLIAYPFWNYCRTRQTGTRTILLLLLAGILLSINLLLWESSPHYIVWSSLFLYFFLTPLVAMNNTLTLEYTDQSNLKAGFRKNRYWGSAGWALLPFAVSFPYKDGILHKLPVAIVSTLIVALAIGLCISLPALKRQNIAPPLTTREIGGVLLNKYFTIFLALGMLVSISNTANLMFMPLFMTDLGGSVLDVAFAIFLSVILETAVMYLLNRYLKQNISSLILCLTLVSLLLALRWNYMASATLPVQVIFVQLLNSATLGGFFYTGIRLTSLFLPKPFRSAGQTVCVICWSGLSGVMAGLLGGWLFQSFGSVIFYKTLVSMTFFGALGFGLMWAHIVRNGYVPSRHHS
ncbi:MFS transporter [Paenibacillus caui]|uniref:MFS transporter n=1 Tax=Paenibacillus caui TaxID=2873927 RepID=UPI001CA83142|nr:MFS transporter [Paenibacillus caui]